MPISASAKKSLRQSRSRRTTNVKKKTILKKTIKGYKDLLKENAVEAAKQLPAVYKVIDKAAKSNLIKKNKANRTKSRLAKKLK